MVNTLKTIKLKKNEKKINKVLTAATFLVALFFGKATQLKAQVGKIEFEKTVINFGNIKEGVDEVREFKFKNTGKKALQIKNAVASCGCVVPTWSKAPIISGQSAVVSIKYVSKNRPGSFTKTITITTDPDTEPVKLTIMGEVIP